MSVDKYKDYQNKGIVTYKFRPKQSGIIEVEGSDKLIMPPSDGGLVEIDTDNPAEVNAIIEAGAVPLEMIMTSKRLSIEDKLPEISTTDDRVSIVGFAESPMFGPYIRTIWFNRGRTKDAEYNSLGILAQFTGEQQ